MFDISIGKLVIIATVAFIVIGPERLPQVARTVGLILGRVQRYIAGIKNELRQEMEKAEFSKLEQTFSTTQIKTEATKLSKASDALENSLSGQARHQVDPAKTCVSPIEENQPMPTSWSSAHDTLGIEKQRDLFDGLPIPRISTQYRDRR
jgi:sec-independent protein translocase protein TatB